MRKRWQAKLREVKAELRSRMHDPVPEQAAYLCRVVDGHCRYYGVPGNGDRLSVFFQCVLRIWGRALARRSQTHRMTWERLKRYGMRWLTAPRIHHPWPSTRFFSVTTQGKSRMR